MESNKLSSALLKIALIGLDIMNTLEYYQKDVYGQTLLYIKDAATAQLIKMLTGKKTVSGAELQILHKLTGKTPLLTIRP